MRKLLLLGLISCGLVPTAWADLNTGLVAYFPFNGNAIDATGNGYDGGVTNAVLTMDRFSNPSSAYLFNGTNSFIGIPKLLPNLTNLTISAWVLYKSGSSFRGYGVVLDDSDTTASNDLVFAVWDATDAYVVAGFTTQIVPLDINIRNRWVQLAWTATATNSTVYLDGSQIFTAAKSGSDIGLHAPPLIGATASIISGRGAFFGGKIDDLRIYNRALGPSEIQALFASEAGPTVNFVKAFTVDFSNLTVGSNYVLQASSDLSNWTNYAAPFTATSVNFTNTEYQRIEDWNELFFRLQIIP